MGWSCSEAAGKTMELWCAACSAATESTNVFRDNGEVFFWEVDSKEWEDGRITGTIQKMVDKDSCVPWGRFQIEPTGRVSRGPRFLMKATPWCYLHNRREPCAYCASVAARSR